MTDAMSDPGADLGSDPEGATVDLASARSLAAGLQRLVRSAGPSVPDP